MATYEQLRDKVLSWSNRDKEVFGNTTEIQNSQLKDFIQYAADKAYRVLRVPALEKTYVYSIDEINNADWIENCCLPIPSDLTEFISLIKTEGAGVNINCPLVFDEKTDYRTFRNTYADRYSSAYWTRFGGNMLLAPFPGINPDDTFELYYYGRLSALDEVYPEGTDEAAGTTGLDGMLIPNWLRDENERIVLFGALAEAFAYLGEDDMQAKYLQMFQQEIDELNREEGQRRASGGNIQMHYNGGLI